MALFRGPKGPFCCITATLGGVFLDCFWGVSLAKTAILGFGRVGAFAETASGARRVHRPAEVDLHTLRFRTTYCTCHLKLYSRFYAVGKLAFFLAPKIGPCGRGTRSCRGPKWGPNREICLSPPWGRGLRQKRKKSFHDVYSQS